MKKIITILGFVSVIVLSACSHKNPMITAPKEKTAQFLIDASTYAEMKMDYKIKDHGVIYEVCLDNGFEKNPGFCPKFYDYMLDYAHQSTSLYKNITLQDLTNKEAFESVHPEYSRLYRKIKYR